MGMEILGAVITPNEGRISVVESTPLPEVDHKVKMSHKQDEPIISGFNGVNGEAKGFDKVDNSNFPKDAVDEWPELRQHTFYLVKYRSYDDPKLKAKFEQADKDVHRKNQARFQITEELKMKRIERAELISQLRPLTAEDKNYRNILDDKRKEMEPLRDALGKMRSASTIAREKGAGLCSSEEELDILIRSLHYRIQHESNTLVEEKQLLKEIKLLEGTRDKVIANSAMRAKIQESMGDREAIQDQVKLIGVDLDEVRKDKQAVRNKIKSLEEKLKAVDDAISSLQEELASATEKKDKAYETLLQLRKTRDETNAIYFKNRSLLNNARELAAKKDIAALKVLSHGEVEEFMSQWSSNKAFRDDYEKRILGSLDYRQLSRDGRIRNPDEKPILLEASAPAEPEIVTAKSSIKKTKEDLKPLAQSNRQIQEDVTKSAELELHEKVEDTLVSEDASAIKTPQKEASKPEEVDPVKLKELKREEEIAKAKLALERKKKLADKAAAKAAIRAQKEAEKKLKEKEKKAKKKAGASLPPTEVTEVDAKVNEPEEADLSSEVPASEIVKERKENVVRHRNNHRGRPKVQGEIPKIVLKKKKAHSQWIWAAPAIVLALVLIAALYYYYAKKLVILW